MHQPGVDRRAQREAWKHAWRTGNWENLPIPEAAWQKTALAHEWEASYHRPRMSRRARVLIPVFVSLLIQVPPALFWMAYAGVTPARIAVAVLAVIGPLALLAARRYPGPVVAIVAVAASADFALSGNPAPPFIALAFAIVGALVRNARVWAWISVGSAWTITLVTGLVLALDWHPARVALTTLTILILFGIGEGMRTRREHFEEFRRATAQRKQTEVQAERVRIARELHDVLAHSLSQINVQASVGLHLMDKQPAKASEALASIKETSKTALDEVRSVLGVLRAEGGQDPSAPLVPEPDLSRLAGLAASVTSQGVDVDLQTSVDAAPKAVQLALYRIVQESLTNVVRHAGATSARVTIAVTNGSYVVSVDDNGSGLGDEHTGGRGMLGMRERAELLGGTLEIAPSELGGLRVTARIPVKDPTE